MPTTYKVLGQSAPAATTNTDLYTVPAGASAVCSTLAICNRSTSTTFRVAVRPSDAALANQHYIVFDNWVNQYDTVFLTLGVTLAAGDVVTVFAGAANLSFSLFGSEIS
jgi:membrane protein YqaA with SNARE-associated domain